MKRENCVARELGERKERRGRVDATEEKRRRLEKSKGFENGSKLCLDTEEFPRALPFLT